MNKLVFASFLFLAVFGFLPVYGGGEFYPDNYGPNYWPPTYLPFPSLPNSHNWTNPIARDDYVSPAIRPGQKIDIDVLGNDFLGRGYGVIIDSVTLPIKGGNAEIRGNAVHGYIRYTAPVFNNNSFTDTFTYRMSTPFAKSNFAKVFVPVIDHAPVAGTYFMETNSGTRLEIPISNILAVCSDPDGDPFSLISFSSPSNGTASWNDVHTKIVYVPAADFTGEDSFEYTIRDNLYGGTGVGRINISVN